MSGFRIAITGTPATGKSSVADIIARTNSITVRELAAEHGCLGEAEKAGEAVEIDVDKLHRILTSEWAEKSPSEGVGKTPRGNEKPDENIYIDGHLSHHLPVDAIIVLRCRPEVLCERMRGRGWPSAKITDNAEWEMLGGPWLELDENSPPILEIDTTIASAAAVASQALEWVGADFVPRFPAERADWIR
jgi:adenylate kinase